MDQSAPSNSSKPLHTPFSSRQTKPGPAPRTRDAVAERRRSLFLNKVRQGRDDKRWEARSDQLARLDYMTQKRQWEAEQALNAPQEYTDEEPEAEILGDEAMNELSGFGAQTQHSPFAGQTKQPCLALDEREAEEVLQREDEEMEALIAMMEDESRTNEQKQEHEQQDASDNSSIFGNDDDVYDSIFRSYEPVGDARLGDDRHFTDDMDTS